jgi:hypothetical protein
MFTGAPLVVVVVVVVWLSLCVLVCAPRQPTNTESIPMLASFIVFLPKYGSTFPAGRKA